MDDFLTRYLQYTENTESHKVYHRWSAIVTIGACLGRSSYIQFGHGKLFPNFYTMLLGEPGARKSSAIKLAKKLVAASGYDTFAADRSSREKFLLDLGGGSSEEDDNGRELAREVRRANGHNITEMNLWGSNSSSSVPKEVYIVADEFNEFVSAGNIDFYTTLGNLWDWDDDGKPFEDKVKNSKSVSIFQPTISLLGGNTQENFARAFPPEILGHGFLSRLLLIHGVPSGRKIAFPEPPSQEATDAIVAGFREIQATARETGGQLLLTSPAKELLKDIYVTHGDIQDPRFKGYNTRRYTHLLKLCIIIAACFSRRQIDEEVVVYSNTLLSAAERTMPESIGEFGKSKHSDVAHKILTLLQDAKAPVGVKQIWSIVHKDLERMPDLAVVLNNLQAAEKIQQVHIPGGKGGWLPKREVPRIVKHVSWDMLSEEERNLI